MTVKLPKKPAAPVKGKAVATPSKLSKPIKKAVTVKAAAKPRKSGRGS